MSLQPERKESESGRRHAKRSSHWRVDEHRAVEFELFISRYDSTQV